MKLHYYPDDWADTDWTTACGRNGHKTGGFIAFFFKMLKSHERCKICNKRFKKDQNKQAVKKYQQSKSGKINKQKQDRKWCSSIRGHLSKVFSNIKCRCNNPKNARYKDYGGRGIQNKFNSFNEFADYVINRLHIDPRNFTIDRIDNDGNYEPGNIRFTTYAENNKNRKRKYDKKTNQSTKIQ